MISGNWEPLEINRIYCSGLEIYQEGRLNDAVKGPLGCSPIAYRHIGRILGRGERDENEKVKVIA